MGRSTQSEGMRLLFVPVRGNDKSFAGKGTGPVSQQQHTAREFHRKARLQTVQAVSLTPATEDNEQRPMEADKHGCRSFSICDKAMSKYIPIDALGAGRIDPFNAFCEAKPTLNVHEMCLIMPCLISGVCSDLAATKQD